MRSKQMQRDFIGHQSFIKKKKKRQNKDLGNYRMFMLTPKRKAVWPEEVMAATKAAPSHMPAPASKTLPPAKAMIIKEKKNTYTTKECRINQNPRQGHL